MLNQYLSAVDGIVGGKRVRSHSYLHVSLLFDQAPPIRRIVETASALVGPDQSTFISIFEIDLACSCPHSEIALRPPP
jgi:hypothetical protein